MPSLSMNEITGGTPTAASEIAKRISQEIENNELWKNVVALNDQLDD